MKPPKCRLCGHEHYGVAHVFASNTESASNNASNTERPEAVSGEVVGRGLAGGSGEGNDKRDAVRHPSEAWQRVAKQRWSREAYNAYQREYMRRRRAGSA
jgi:hypothetical protein